MRLYMKTPARNAGVSFFTEKSERSDNGSLSAVASLNSVVSAGDRPAALTLSGIVGQRAESKGARFSAAGGLSVDFNAVVISRRASNATVTAGRLISVGANRTAGRARVRGGSCRASRAA